MVSAPSASACEAILGTTCAISGAAYKAERDCGGKEKEEEVGFSGGMVENTFCSKRTYSIARKRLVSVVGWT